jgi:hypothetical protein
MYPDQCHIYLKLKYNSKIRKISIPAPIYVLIRIMQLMLVLEKCSPPLFVFELNQHGKHCPASCREADYDVVLKL